MILRMECLCVFFLGKFKFWTEYSVVICCKTYFKVCSLCAYLSVSIILFFFVFLLFFFPFENFSQWPFCEWIIYTHWINGKGFIYFVRCWCKCSKHRLFCVMSQVSAKGFPFQTTRYHSYQPENVDAQHHLKTLNKC